MTCIGTIGAVLAAGLLAGRDGLPETPENWKIKLIDGKTFYNKNIGPKAHVWKLWDNMAGDPLFEAVWYDHALPLHMNDVTAKHTPNGDYYFAPPKYEGYPKPVRFTDALAKAMKNCRRDYVEEFAARAERADLLRLPRGASALAAEGRVRRRPGRLRGVAREASRLLLVRDLRRV